MESIKLNETGLRPDSKCKLYIQFGLTRNISVGPKTEVFKGVKLSNVSRIVSKCNQENIKRIIVKINAKSAQEKDNAYVLYKAPELL